MASTAALAIVAPYAGQLARPIDDVAGDLESFSVLLRKWQAVQNLVSRETLPELWTRHVADSLQVLNHLHDDDLRILDIGSGGGFPGLPVAIALKGSARVLLLVEPNGRKASFLRTVTRELALPVTVLDARIEDLDSRETPAPDVITARAVAALPALLGMAAPLFGAGTRGIFHKGREFGDELQEAAAAWYFDVVVHQSRLGAGGVLLEIANLRTKSEI